ncbi:hypothetical protein FGO68_gene16916 [Halteria grandinella]|uniref:Uncharacterized protein n=1 Tax=Halteria grandinella TaxID=5974 RepID=A0A8J8NB37_HALGN|nr:hypothetical protein FGO68_gene16916 [Halteria grandinella]
MHLPCFIIFLNIYHEYISLRHYLQRFTLVLEGFCKVKYFLKPFKVDYFENSVADPLEAFYQILWIVSFRANETLINFDENLLSFSALNVVGIVSF